VCFQGIESSGDGDRSRNFRSFLLESLAHCATPVSRCLFEPVFRYALP
jgi:hypothetical protein